MKPNTSIKKQYDYTLLEKLTHFLLPLIQQSNFKRKCKKLPDFEWIEAGILRAIFQEPSGRGFLQSLVDMGKNLIKRSHFFESLKSKRRLRLCQDVNQMLLEQLQKSLGHNVIQSLMDTRSMLETGITIRHLSMI
jgi:hypothetical protein